MKKYAIDLTTLYSCIYTLFFNFYKNVIESSILSSLGTLKILEIINSSIVASKLNLCQTSWKQSTFNTKGRKLDLRSSTERSQFDKKEKRS